MVVDSLPKQLPFALILAGLMVLLSAMLNQLHVLQRWDNLFYDIESAAIKRTVNEQIVIVAIDDDSLRKLGRWPWPRSLHARLLNELTEVDVAAIGMDVLFMEPDLKHPESDRELVAAIRRNKRVVLPVLTSEQAKGIVETKPLADIAVAAAQLAHVNMHFDSQGVVRQFYLQLELHDGQVLPAMSLALSRLLPGHVEPSDRDFKKSQFVSFAGPPGHFQQYSYADVLLNSNIRNSLRGKIVLIGMTAAGLGSSVATPVSKSDQLMSGIEFQANALTTILSGQIIRPVEWQIYILISAVLIGLPILLFRFFTPGVALLLAVGFSIFTWVISFYLLKVFQVWFTPLPILLCLILSYPLWSFRRLEQLGQSLFNEHEKAGATLKAIGDAVITTDNQDCIEFMNPAAEKMLAYTLAEVKQRPFKEVCRIAGQDGAVLLDNYALSSNRQPAETRVLRNRLNVEFAVRISSRQVQTENGLPAGVVYALSDLTEIININRKIAFIAAHDTLTGLPNRVLLQDRLEQAINSASREGLKFAVLFIDLDGFKKINDGMGHACGDLLLQKVADRLRKWIRQADTISRWGGDEFIILLEKLSLPQDAADVAVKIIQSLSQSFLINKQLVFITPSIGISLFPEDGERAEDLLAKADTAMYSVKKNGRNNFCYYSLDLEHQAKERLVLETELRQALQASEFEIFYQPQIDLETDRLIGAEALIRWRHPEKGLVAPDDFIPLLEEIGLIVPIGEWIVKTVCRQLQSWGEQGLPVIKVAINLSARQFAQKNLVRIITREIEKHGLATGTLQVEITESMMIQDIDRVIKVLDDLKSAGISIAVDDFGTGYSSLEYLKRFPIDKLKIDKSFVDSVLDNSDDASIVQAVIALGHNMNMQIIAEGVETEEQARFLLERHCDYGQGYFYSKPIAAEAMGSLIEDFQQSGKT